MNKKIRRRCRCGCGSITNYGRIYINNHHRLGKRFSEEHKKNISLALMGNTHTLGQKRSEEAKQKMSLAQAGKKRSEESKLKMSLAHMGNKNAFGYKHTKEARLNMSLAHIKYDPTSQYCEIWRDREYTNDIRKDYCENVNCENNYKQLNNHHIYLDKKRCAPNDVITLCVSCHVSLHHKLREDMPTANPKNYIIVNRPDHVSYISKPTRKIVRIIKINKK